MAHVCRYRRPWSLDDAFLDSPPLFAAQFAEVEVDTGTGQVTVARLVSAVVAGSRSIRVKEAVP